MGKAEKVRGRHQRLAEAVVKHFVARDEAITSDNDFRVRIPEDQLLVTVSGFEVEMVKVGFFARASASGAESNLAQASDFFQDVWRALVVHNVQLVARMIGVAHEVLGREFGFEQLGADRGDDVCLLHFCNL